MAWQHLVVRWCLMNIKNIRINNFGKLSDFEISFESSKNIIYGKNEQGKSTLMAFIRAIFYGLSGNSRNDLAQNPRKKYMTWGKSEICGFIEFMQNNKMYRIERSFGITPSKDTIQILDLVTNTKIPISVKKEPGEIFFDMNEDSFEKSVFVGQIGSVIYPGKSSGNEIIQRLQNLVSSADETGSYNDVLKNITLAMEKIKSKGGKIGTLDKIYAKEISLSDRKHLALKLEEEKSGLKHLYENLLMQKKDTSKQIDEIRRKLKNVILIKKCEKVKVAEINYESAESEYNAEREKLSELEKNGENAVTEEEYLLLENSLEEHVAYSNLKTEKEKEKQIYTGIIKDLESKYENESGLDKISKGSKFAYLILSIIITGVLFLSGHITRLNNFYYLGIIFFAIFITWFIKDYLKSKKITKEVKIERINYESQISDFKRKITECEMGIEKSSDLMIDLNYIIEGIYSKYNVYRREEIHKMYLSKAFNDEKLKSLREFVLHRQEQSVRLKNEYLKLKKEFEEERNRSEITGEIAIDYEDEDKISSELENLNANLQDLQSKITDLKYRLLHEYKNREELSEVIEETENNSRQKQFYEDEYQSLEIARSLLIESFEEMQSSFGPVVNKKCSDIIKEISDGAYDEIIVSKDFEISIRENKNNTTREWKYLSSGTADLVYFALRLAISEVFSKDKDSIPLFLDDAFLQYDDERTKMAIKFLENYAEKRNIQIFLFTCHKPEKEIGERFAFLQL